MLHSQRNPQPQTFSKLPPQKQARYEDTQVISTLNLPTQPPWHPPRILHRKPSQLAAAPKGSLGWPANLSKHKKRSTKIKPWTPPPTPANHWPTPPDYRLPQPTYCHPSSQMKSYRWILGSTTVWAKYTRSLEIPKIWNMKGRALEPLVSWANQTPHRCLTTTYSILSGTLMPF